MFSYLSQLFIRSCAGKSPLVLAQDKPEILEILKKQSEAVENSDHQISSCKKNILFCKLKGLLLDQFTRHVT